MDYYERRRLEAEVEAETDFSEDGSTSTYVVHFANGFIPDRLGDVPSLTSELKKARLYTRIVVAQHHAKYASELFGAIGKPTIFEIVLKPIRVPQE